jgi:hypothetical protein
MISNIAYALKSYKARHSIYIRYTTMGMGKRYKGNKIAFDYLRGFFTQKSIEEKRSLRRAYRECLKLKVEYKKRMDNWETYTTWEDDYKEQTKRLGYEVRG